MPLTREQLGRAPMLGDADGISQEPHVVCASSRRAEQERQAEARDTAQHFQKLAGPFSKYPEAQLLARIPIVRVLGELETDQILDPQEQNDARGGFRWNHGAWIQEKRVQLVVGHAHHRMALAVPRKGLYERLLEGGCVETRGEHDHRPSSGFCDSHGNGSWRRVGDDITSGS